MNSDNHIESIYYIIIVIFNGLLHVAKYFAKYSSPMGYCILRNISQNID